MNRDQRAPSDHGNGTGANASFMQPSTSSAFGYRRSRQTNTALTGTRLRMPDADDTELTQPGTISRSGARSAQLPTVSLVNSISHGATQGRNINDNATLVVPSRTTTSLKFLEVQMKLLLTETYKRRANAPDELIRRMPIA